MLGNRKLGNAASIFDTLHNRYNNMMVAHLSYPRENRPFEENPQIPKLFTKAKRDYFDGILLLTNDIGEIIPNALKFPKKAFQYIYNAINLGEEEEMDPLASPYPIEVTQKMLDCFEGEYILQKQKPINIWLGRIADIGEELWMYSKNREYLIDEEDRHYLSDNLDEIKKRIDGILKDIEPNVSQDILSMVKELCSMVYQGNLFDDKNYNQLISYIQTIGEI